MSDPNSKANRFGTYIRRARIQAGRSLREVAEAVGISHVYLGEVERGIRGPLKPEHWSALSRAIPGLARDQLQRAADISRPLQIDLSGAPRQYQNLALALARRFKRRDLSGAELAKLLEVLTARDE